MAMTKGEVTRTTILEAAIARFGRDGYRATSVADIARDAGVGGTVAYAYFPNKEAAIQALERGGNVVDAAVAAAFVKMIVDPQMCGVGGFGVSHLYSAATGETTILDYPSPAGSLITCDDGAC